MTTLDPQPFDPQNPELWARGRLWGAEAGFVEWARRQPAGFTPRGCRVLGLGWAYFGAYQLQLREQAR